MTTQLGTGSSAVEYGGHIMKYVGVYATDMVKAVKSEKMLN